MKNIYKIALLFLFPILLFAKTDYALEAKNIEDTFVKVIEVYKAGDIQKAKELTQTAYFSHFENLEGGIRINLSAKKSYSMEAQFGQIRKAIVAKAPVEEIEAKIANLTKEIDEVLPIIEAGTRLVGEYSDSSSNTLAKQTDATKTSNLANQNAQPSKQSQPTQTSQNENENQNANQTAQNPWNAVYSDILAKLQVVKDDFKNKKFDDLKLNLNNEIKFNLYRNTQLEIAIRKYISQNFDQQIQQIMGSLISNSPTFTQDKFDLYMKDLDDLLKTAVAKLPSESYALAPKVEIKEEKSVDFAPVVKNIATKLALSLEKYKNGEVNDAISDSQDIYFDEYEASGMENKVGAIDINLKTSTEASFSKIVALMKSGADATRVKEAQDELISKLNASLEKTSGSNSPLALFLYSLTIILREGFEALIIVAAVVAYLVKTGNQNRLSIVYSSLSTAVVLSFVVAYLANLMFENAGQSREVIEGATMLVAVLLLFYVGFWLLSNAGAKKWNTYIKGHIASSLSSGSSKALWWTVFLAVFREGAETVLFYQALIFDAKTPSLLFMVAAGFVVGLVLLIIVYFVFKFSAVKIPIRPFFLITSTIIFYMSIVFTGKGVMELVEGKVFIPTHINGALTIEWLGVYPYYESLVPQLILLAILVIGIFIMKAKAKIS
ncbi:FTR1 family iron permease [Campylobacter geochelonis]|uniref:FTR1 family iron permease n=1 Tax=Campylobacter geochelonis TaxID=1780362 RepID=A0A128EG36_9BACT|nr:FTR1 family protein [Campylobacter geochelonis]QKF71935.1 ferrirhodotorulic acid ABC transporter, inner membrane protein [Campylobacter geochelonis]CZE47844.1 FTR1 family iron permease [Campylobacter geochelonis]